jgi:uncharacterized protein YndB with AHSA1/START domain
MPPIVSIIEVARPPAEVFSYMTDPTRFTEWQGDVVSVQVEGDRSTGVGSRFTTVRRIGGTERSMTQEVTEVSPPRTWAAKGVEGIIRPQANVTVEPLDGGVRSQVTISLDFEGHGVGVPLIPLVRRLAQKGGAVSYQHLKTLLENAS